MSKETSQTQRVVLLAGYSDIRSGFVEIANNALTSAASNDITVFAASSRKRIHRLLDWAWQ